MWWIIIIAVIGFIIYQINKDHKKHVNTNITNYGGMQTKYNVLIEYLKASGQQIQKTTKESVMLASKSMNWNLDYVGNNLEVRMNAFMPLLGNIKNKWTFPNGYPQEKMIEEIENYLDWQVQQMQKIAQNNPYEHLK